MYQIRLWFDLYNSRHEIINVTCNIFLVFCNILLVFYLEHDYCHVHLLNTNNTWHSSWFSIFFCRCSMCCYTVAWNEETWQGLSIWSYIYVHRYWNGGSCCFWEWWLCWSAMQCPESGWPSFIQGCSLEILSSYLLIK